jgi:rhodanese-related sulfurtransferase
MRNRALDFADARCRRRIDRHRRLDAKRFRQRRRAHASAPATATPGPAEYHKLLPEEAKTRIDSGDPVVIVDVRTAAEFAESRIPGAINVPNAEILDQMPEALPDKDAELLIYCRSGRRSSDAAHKLVAMGYTRVYDFGGIIDWPYETEQ